MLEQAGLPMTSEAGRRICLWGGGFKNKGAEAMLLVVRQELSRRLDGARFHARLHRRQARLARSSGLLPLALGDDRLGRLLGVAASNRWSVYRYLAGRGDLKRLAGSLLNYREASDYCHPRRIDALAGGLDAVVSVHGFAFGGPWGVGAARMAAQWARFCHESGTPLIFMPQAWGPFEKEEFREPLREMVHRSSLCYARDAVSRTHLARLLEEDENDIPLAPDIAFLFPSASPEQGDLLLRRIGVEAGQRPLLGVAPNMKVYQRTGGTEGGNSYIQLLARLCDHAVDRFGAGIILIPNDISPAGDGRTDDSHLCGLVHAAVQHPAACFPVRGYRSAEEIHALAGRCDLLVGSRFHALVFALAQGVPALALSWAHKYRELLGTFGMEDAVCEHDTMEPDRVVALLDRVWEERGSRAAALGEQLPAVREQVAAVFDRAAAILRGTGS